jgi:hypothetical protein
LSKRYLVFSRHLTALFNLNLWLKQVHKLPSQPKQRLWSRGRVKFKRGEGAGFEGRSLKRRGGKCASEIFHVNPQKYFAASRGRHWWKFTEAYKPAAAPPGSHMGKMRNKDIAFRFHSNHRSILFFTFPALEVLYSARGYDDAAL